MSLNNKLVGLLTQFLDENRAGDLTNDVLSKTFVESVFGMKTKKKVPRKKAPNGYIHWSKLNREKTCDKLEKSKDEYEVTQRVKDDEGNVTKSKVKKTYKQARNDERNRIITTILGHQWSKLSDDDKKKYKEMARVELESKEPQTDGGVVTQVTKPPSEDKQCPKCPKVYKTQKNLDTHLADKHPATAPSSEESKGKGKGKKKEVKVKEEEESELLED